MTIVSLEIGNDSLLRGYAWTIGNSASAYGVCYMRSKSTCATCPFVRIL